MIPCLWFIKKLCFRIGFVRVWLINIAQHFMFLEDKLIEAYSSSSKMHFVYCTCITSFSFNFDWLYPMTYVSSGDKKGVVFFITFASSFMWCGQFFQEELYIIFTSKPNLRQKSRLTTWSHFNIANIRWHHI